MRSEKSQRVLLRLLAFGAALIIGGLALYPLHLVTENKEYGEAFLYSGSGDFRTVLNLAANLAAIEGPKQNSQDEGFGWTAVGSIYNSKNGRESLAWWEAEDANALAWTLRRPRLSAGRSQRFLDVASTQTLQVGVGSEDVGQSSIGSVWYRTSAGEWNRSKSDPFGIGRDEALLAVAIASDESVLVLGSYEQNSERRYSIWHSNDLLNFERSPLEVPSDVTINDIAAGPLGGFVAVGQRTLEDGRKEARIWFSAEGLRWQLVEISDSVFADKSVVLNGVSSNGQYYVAVGGENQDAEYTPRAWISQDGSSWEADAIFFENPPADQRVAQVGHAVQGISFGSEGFIAFSDLDFLQQVWRSVDGRAWTNVGNIRQFGEYGVPVAGVGSIRAEEGDIVTVAITRDAGIWRRKTNQEWGELNLSSRVLPQSLNRFSFGSVHWDNSRKRFVAAEEFQEVEGQLRGVRLWESDISGRNWKVSEEYFGRNASSIFGARILAATGSDKRLLVKQNSNPIAEVWLTDSNGNWMRPQPVGLEPNFAEGLLAGTQIRGGFVVGGWAFYPRSNKQTDALLSVGIRTGTEISWNLVSPADLGLATEKNDWVSAICSDIETQRIVVFGTSVTDLGTKISVSFSQDSAQTWLTGGAFPDELSNISSFEDRAIQEITDCTVVPKEICEDSDTIFQNTQACASGENFFLAAGVSEIGGQKDARLWWSPDGVAWALVSLPDGLSGPGDQELIDVVADQRGIVLVGNDTRRGVMKGNLWIEEEGRWVELETGLTNDLIPVEFISAAMNPSGQLVVSGRENNRTARLWYGREPIFEE